MNIWEVDKVFLFITIILPGFISIKIYDLIVAGDKRDFSKSLVEAISYSVMNFGLLSWLILIISEKSFAKEHQNIYFASLALIFVICPIIWPFIFVRLSKLEIFKKHFLGPVNQPWDRVFTKREAMWVVVHLKENRTIRGKYSLNSSASAYPKERQIYLEEVWTEGANGGFGKKVARTKGIILFESEISYIEFLK
jgi:uncharacterized protein DUF6338